MIHERIKLSKNAFLATYILDNYEEIDINRKRITVVICPGGGYEMTSDREAEAIAIKMLNFGFHAIVLKYSVAPSKFPDALIELATTVSMLREKKEEWNIDENKIIICGFSAGGHLAASLGTLWNSNIISDVLNGSPESWKPNGLCLSYPVITSGKYGHQGSINNLSVEYNQEERNIFSLENHVSSFTPQTFIWHTGEDDCVPVENTLLFVNSLQKNKIPYELHIFPNGGHGLSLANRDRIKIWKRYSRKLCTVDKLVSTMGERKF